MNVQDERFLERGFRRNSNSVGHLQDNGQPLSGGFDSGTVNATMQGRSQTIAIRQAHERPLP